MLAKAHLALTLVAIALAASLLLAWRSERIDRAQLQATLQSAEQSLQRASAIQQQRDKQLGDTLAKLESLKATVRSQQDILAHLPDVLPLPTPLASGVQDPMPTNREAAVNAPPQPPGDSNHKTQAAPSTTIPPEDLKPLYDFAVDCRACQARLATATADLQDEKSKTQTLSRERDAALQLARGGSLRRRIARAAKWFVLGAIAGAVAAKAH